MKRIKDRVAGLREAEGYVPDETAVGVARQLKVGMGQIVKLDTNENYFIPPSLLVGLAKELAETLDLRLYPQEEDLMLIDSLSEYLDVHPDCITLGNGSDQLIDLIFRLSMGGGGEVVSVKPTFSMYRILSDVGGYDYIEAPLNNDFSLDADALLSKTTSNTTVCFLCSPNNPTATQFEDKAVRDVIEMFDGIVVVDEAYAEFAESTMLRMVNKFENLIVLRTLSKAFGLAGLRIGYAVSNPDMTIAMRKLQLPYPLSTFSALMALKMLERTDLIEEAIRKVKEERKRLIRGLNSISGVKAFDSDTNFVLFQTEREGDRVHEELIERRVLVRKIGRVMNLDNCLRTTVGLPEMNRRLMEALRAVAGR